MKIKIFLLLLSLLIRFGGNIVNDWAQNFVAELFSTLSEQSKSFERFTKHDKCTPPKYLEKFYACDESTWKTRSDPLEDFWTHQKKIKNLLGSFSLYLSILNGFTTNCFLSLTLTPNPSSHKRISQMIIH